LNSGYTLLNSPISLAKGIDFKYIQQKMSRLTFQDKDAQIVTTEIQDITTVPFVPLAHLGWPGHLNILIS